MKQLVRYFVQGCLVTAPIAITVYVVMFVLTTLDQIMPVKVPVLGFLLLVAIVTAIGFVASSVVGEAVVREGERWLNRVPLIKVLYNSIKDLIGAFVGDKKSFDKPVMVSLVPGSSAKALGFLTRDKLTFLEDHVAVYLPQSYNFAGNVIICRRDLVTPLDVNSADLMAFIVSGGVSKTRHEAESMMPPPPHAAGG
jgi:uncharacterized membrane protein